MAQTIIDNKKISCYNNKPETKIKNMINEIYYLEVEDKKTDLVSYYAKTSKFEEAEVSPDYYDYEPTREEIIEGILLRLAHRYSPLECSYFKEYTCQPINALDLDPSSDYYATTATIRKYLKLHQEDPEKFPTPFMFEKLAEIEPPMEKKKKKPKKDGNSKKIEIETKENEENHGRTKTLKNEVTNRGNVVDGKYIPNNKNKLQPDKESYLPKLKKENYLINQMHIESLPSLTGGLRGKDNTIVGSVILPDTGSEISVLSAKKLYELGFKDHELDKTFIFQINTATGQDSSLGIICLDLFLKAMNGMFYRLEIHFVVIKQDIDKVLIGYNDLKKYATKWDLSDNKEHMVLSVLNPDNNWVRRTFSTLSPQNPLPMQAKLSDKWATFYTENFPNISNNVLNCHQLEMNGELAPSLCQYQIESEHASTNRVWPIRAKFTYSNRVNKNLKEDISGVLMPGSNNIPQFTDEELDILDRQVENYNIEAKFPAFNDIDEQVLEKVSFPILDTKEAMEKKKMDGLTKLPNIPNCEHVPENHRKRFEGLFKEYEDCFASSQFDIGTVNIPPIKINHDPNDPVFESPKKYTPDELLILDDYIEQMLEAGIIEKVSTESKWNSNLVMVISSPHESKKIRSSLKDNLTKEDRLKALKKSLRPCLDLRRVNNKLGNPNGTLALPSLEQLLPDLRNTLASS